MEIKVSLEEKKKVNAHFKNFVISSDQPIEGGGDNSAPSPFDLFFASTALCAGFFMKEYCVRRNISTDGIVIVQENSAQGDDYYKQEIVVKVKFPESISDKDRVGILRAAEGCTVKKVINNIPVFKIEAV